MNFLALKTVLLDVGNTLLRERPSRAEIYARAGRARGVEVETERMLELMREHPIQVSTACLSSALPAGGPALICFDWG